MMFLPHENPGLLDLLMKEMAIITHVALVA